MLQHGRVQATRQLKFLEAFNCVIKRSASRSQQEQDEEGAKERTEQEDQQEDQQQQQEEGAEEEDQYFYCSRPDPSVKFFVHLKCIYDYWDRLVFLVLHQLIMHEELPLLCRGDTVYSTWRCLVLLSATALSPPDLS